MDMTLQEIILQAAQIILGGSISYLVPSSRAIVINNAGCYQCRERHQAQVLLAMDVWRC